MAETRRAPTLHLSLFAAAAAAMAVLAPVSLAGAEYANPHGLAVIIGNRTYGHSDVPPVDYAHRDAEAFRRYVLDVLGYDPPTSSTSRTPPGGGWSRSSAAPRRE